MIIIISNIYPIILYFIELNSLITQRPNTVLNLFVSYLKIHLEMHSTNRYRIHRSLINISPLLAVAAPSSNCQTPSKPNRLIVYIKSTQPISFLFYSPSISKLSHDIGILLTNTIYIVNSTIEKLFRYSRSRVAN